MNPNRVSILILLIGTFVLAGCLSFPGAEDQPAQTLTGTSTSTAVGQESTSIVSARETQPAHLPAPTEGQPTETPTLLPPPIEVPASSEPPLQTVPALAPGQPVTISFIDMIDAEVGWAIGGNQDPGRHILHTRDGGQTWRDVTPPETVKSSLDLTEYARGFFPDSENAWVTFYSDHVENNHVWRTSDGGQTWSHGHPVPNDISLYWPRFLQFVDDNNGWLVIGGIGLGNEYISMFATTDGGETWVKLFDPNTSGPQGCMKTGMLFADAQHAWLTVDCTALASGGAELDQTNDGGHTWGILTLPLPEGVPDLYYQLHVCSLHSPNLFSSQSGFLVLKCRNTEDPGQIQEFLFGTTDGGESWFTNPYPGGALLMLDQNFGWALGRDIYQTTDGGLTWEHIKTVNWDGQFDFVNENTGFAVARSADEIALVRTDDGGRTWMLLEPLVVP